MGLHVDQMGREVFVENVPKRIISLVPSQTELLYDLGLGQEVIGITKFCVHPDEWFKNKTRIGGTKKLDIEKIKSLHPDLILANKEENTEEQIEELSNYFPVWISDVNNLTDALSMISSVAKITGTTDKGKHIISKIKESFQDLQSAIYNRQSACYLIWQEPYMTVGGDTFISDMMLRAGFENIFRNKNRYPKTSIEELNELPFDVLMLSSEPFPFKQKHVEELQIKLPGKKIMLADGEYFSWYGSRMLGATDYFRSLKL
ncbi:MAG: ABC transporter substrate-binding protein [Flavisolibacter sp.]